MLDLKAAFPVWAERRKVNFARDRGATVGASEIGRCARQVAAEKILARTGQTPPPQQINGAAVRGDILEDNVTIPWLETALELDGRGAKLIWAKQEEQQQFVSEIWKMSATPDGLIINAPRDILSKYGVTDTFSDCIVVDAKSFDPRKSINSFPEPWQQDQLIQQMGLVRAATDYKPLWGILVYVDASFLDNHKVVPVRFTEEHFTELKRRAQALMTAENPAMIRPEGKIAGGKECKTCWMLEQCGGYAECVPDTTKPIEELPGSMRMQIRSAVGTIANSKRQLDDFKMRHEIARANLKELLTAANTKHLKGKLTDGREFKVSWRKTNGAKTKVDVPALLEAAEIAGLDTSQFQIEGEGKASETLTVSLTGDDNDDAYGQGIGRKITQGDNHKTKKALKAKKEKANK